MNLNHLTVFRRIMEHPIPRILSELVECSSQEGEEKASQLVALLIRQSEKYLLEGPVLEAWLWHRILGDVNAFSMNCENGWQVPQESSLYQGGSSRSAHYQKFACRRSGMPENLWLGRVCGSICALCQKASGHIAGRTSGEGAERVL